MHQQTRKFRQFKVAARAKGTLRSKVAFRPNGTARPNVTLRSKVAFRPNGTARPNVTARSKVAVRPKATAARSKVAGRPKSGLKSKRAVSSVLLKKPTSVLLERGSGSVQAVVNFETLVYFYPTDDAGNGVFRFEMVPRAVTSGAGAGSHYETSSGGAGAAAPGGAAGGPPPPPPPPVGAAAPVTAVAGTLEQSVADTDAMYMLPIETFAHIAQMMSGNGGLRQALGAALDQHVNTVLPNHQLRIPVRRGVVSWGHDIYVDYDTEPNKTKPHTHASIHVDVRTLGNPVKSGKGVNEFNTLTSEHAGDESNAGLVHMKYLLRSSEECCAGIQWQMSMTVNPTVVGPAQLVGIDSANGGTFSLAYKAVMKFEKKGDPTQQKFVKDMASVMAKNIVDVGTAHGVFANPRLDTRLKHYMTWKLAADCVSAGQGLWSDAATGSAFNMFDFEQKVNAGTAHFAMVMERETAQYQPYFCTNVKAALLNPGTNQYVTLPEFSGIRLVSTGAHGYTWPQATGEDFMRCAFSKELVTAKSFMTARIGEAKEQRKKFEQDFGDHVRNMVPVRQLYPAELAVVGPLLAEPLPSDIRSILSHREDQRKEKADYAAAVKALEATELESRKKAEETEAKAADAKLLVKAAASSAAAASVRVVSSSDLSSILQAISIFAKDTGMVPFKTDAEEILVLCVTADTSMVDRVNASDIEDILVEIRDECQTFHRKSLSAERPNPGEVAAEQAKKKKPLGFLIEEATSIYNTSTRFNVMLGYFNDGLVPRDFKGDDKKFKSNDTYQYHPKSK